MLYQAESMMTQQVYLSRHDRDLIKTKVLNGMLEHLCERHHVQLRPYASL